MLFSCVRYLSDESIQFIGDIHQPLHDEKLDVGGNDIDVTFDGTSTNLHHIVSFPTLCSQKLYSSSNTIVVGYQHAREIRWRLRALRRQILGHHPHHLHQNWILQIIQSVLA